MKPVVNVQYVEQITSPQLFHHAFILWTVKILARLLVDENVLHWYALGAHSYKLPVLILVGTRHSDVTVDNSQFINLPVKYI